MKTCKDVEIICTKAQYKEATLLEKIRIKIHLILCGACKKFVKKNTKLSSLCSQADLKTLPSEEKERMKQELKAKIQ